MIAAGEHYEGIARLELSVVGQALDGRFCIVPHMGLGYESRCAVVTGRLCFCSEKADTVVPSETMFCYCWMIDVADRVIAKERLGVCARRDVENGSGV